LVIGFAGQQNPHDEVLRIDIDGTVMEQRLQVDAATF
jgi:hypothetical protein